MGLGGALIWSGLARNLKKTFPDKKIVFIYKKSWKGFLKPHPDHIIFKNNPDIEKVLSKQAYIFLKLFKPHDWLIVDMDKKEMLYWEKESLDKKKIFFKNNSKHAIQIACDYYGIKQADLRPKIVFLKEEIQKVEQILKKNNLSESRFLVVEPNIKTDFSQNKKWVWENWQKLVNLLKDKNIVVVQIGVKGGRVLNNVIDLTGQTSFREAICLISKAKVFVGIEGGLAHGASATNVRSVILISGFTPKELFAYPKNINLYKGNLCQEACGLKEPCFEGVKCMAQIKVEEVLEAALKLWNS